MKIELELHPDNPNLVLSARYVKKYKSYDIVTYERRFPTSPHPSPDTAVRVLLERVNIEEN